MTHKFSGQRPRLQLPRPEPSKRHVTTGLSKMAWVQARKERLSGAIVR